MNKSKKIIITIAVVFLAIISVAVGYSVNASKITKEWEDKIYPGVKAYGVDLGGLTREEAIEKLNNELTNLIKEKTIAVNAGDKAFELKYSDIAVSIDSEQTAEDALKYGKDKGMFDKFKKIKKDGEYTVETKINYEEEKLKEFEDKVYNEVLVAGADAKISINNGNIDITPEENGKAIDKEELHKKLVETISPDPKAVETVAVELKVTTPKVTAEALAKIDGKISSFTGSYTNNGTGRVTNMELATNFVNGTLLMPGDEFSYNKTIGDTTPERGYKEANTYLGSEVVPGYGGGVCQVSTYLYRAVMRANLRSTIRYNHSMMVSYAEASMDATVAEGDIDYRFKNTYDFPVYIEGIMTGNQIIFNLYGNVAGMDGKEYELVNEIVQKFDFETKHIDDPTLPEGTTKVKISGAPGYKSNGYLITKKDGVEIAREHISTDVYQPLDTIIQRGTKKVEAPKPEQPKPQEPKPEQPKPEGNQ